MKRIMMYQASASVSELGEKEKESRKAEVHKATQLIEDMGKLKIDGAPHAFFGTSLD